MNLINKVSAIKILNLTNDQVANGQDIYSRAEVLRMLEDIAQGVDTIEEVEQSKVDLTLLRNNLVEDITGKLQRIQYSDYVSLDLNNSLQIEIDFDESELIDEVREIVIDLFRDYENGND